MTETFLPVGAATVEQGEAWITLNVRPRCPTKVGSIQCASHTTKILDAATRALHVATGDHDLFWLCTEHGPEALDE
jgi:hypothetical protein